MIHLYFHWKFIVIAILLLIGIYISYNFSKTDGLGFKTMVGYFILFVLIVLSIVIYFII
jgi:hypothetical protein